LVIMQTEVVEKRKTTGERRAGLREERKVTED